MKFDKFGCLIREKYEPEFELGNLGDSAAETCRAAILGDKRGNWAKFILPQWKGYVRHPLLEHVKGWDAKDFSVDQAMALFMWVYLNTPDIFHEFQKANRFFICGTRTLLSVGCWAVLHKNWWLLEKANQVQGWLLTQKYRWSDDKKWFEKVDGKVQDYANLICIHVFLKQLGYPTKLPRPKEECSAAIRKYYLEGHDAEPNSKWLVDLYDNKLFSFAMRGDY